MTLCPIALAVHCVGCPLVKFCPAKTIIGDYNKYAPNTPPESVVEGMPPEETKTDSPQ